MRHALAAAVALALLAPVAHGASADTKVQGLVTYRLKCVRMDNSANQPTVQNTTGQTIPDGTEIELKLAVGDKYPHVVTRTARMRTLGTNRAIFPGHWAWVEQNYPKYRSCTATVKLPRDVAKKAPDLKIKPKLERHLFPHTRAE